VQTPALEPAAALRQLGGRALGIAGNAGLVAAIDP
jgi:hypothetical protein